MRVRTALGVATTLVLATVFVYIRHSNSLPQTWAIASSGLLAELGTPLPLHNASESAENTEVPWRPPSWTSKFLPDPDDEAKEPLAPMPVARRPNVLVVTLASGNYRQFGVELMESAVKHFCKECNLTLLIMTDDTTGLPSLDGRLVAGEVPWRPWPRSTISKCTDLEPYDALIRQQDFAIFLDADMVFVNDVALEEIWGDYVAVEHPYYPRNDRGWCGKWGGEWQSTQPNGFDRSGRFTFCQYPYHFYPNSKAYVPIGYGKKGPNWDSGNSYYLQGALFGGTGIRFSQMCATMAANVADDDQHNVVAGFHDESHLNALLLHRYARTRILGFEYMHPPLGSAASFTWVKVDRPRLIHREKDLETMRQPPTQAPTMAAPGTSPPPPTPPPATPTAPAAAAI